MAKVNILIIICRSATLHFQFIWVILNKVVTRFAHIWQFFGFGFWSVSEWEGQVSEVGSLILRG